VGAHAKNVVIFSDGTGQAGGINFDEVRTNVYKLYRACRVGPDTRIDPSEQVAFYDPGLGSGGRRRPSRLRLDAQDLQSVQYGDRTRHHRHADEDAGAGDLGRIVDHRPDVECKQGRLDLADAD
jgi:uncharacterized protein (DUF2235 family)